MTKRAASRFGSMAGLTLLLAVSACHQSPAPLTHIDSLDDLSVEALRARGYHSAIEPLQHLDLSQGPGTSVIARYDSDGLLNRGSIYQRKPLQRQATPC